MSSLLSSLEPKLVWSHFEAICGVPHPSKAEEKIAALVAEWAADRGFETARDEAGSMVVRVPASAGCESAPTVVLQGHLDMVCEKNNDVEHDFDTEPIRPVVDGDWVRAEGTTLGADNGVGVATAMAIADDTEAVHGPLEILCTIDEETGLTGAKLLDASMLKGRMMVNLDTEEDGSVYIGCAGGADTDARLPLARRRALMGTVPVRVTVRGLRGGHSGLNIIENRGNAIKLVVRALTTAIDDGLELDLVRIDGGSKHNAIPRECVAICRVMREGVAALSTVLDACKADFEEELGAVEPDLDVVLEELDDADELQQVLNLHARDRLLLLLDALPHGVLSMSREVDGLVESSTNVAVVVTGEKEAELVMSHRSSVMPALFAVRHQVASCCRLAGAAVTEDDAYPGWKPNPSSPLVQRTVNVFTRLFGNEPKVKAIHAGLECGLLIEKIPGMDAVSIGPEIHNAHSPDEMVQISSVQRFYEHVKALLADIARSA